MDGYSKPEEIVQRLIELDQHAIAITDHGTVSGLMSMKNAVNDMNKDRAREGLEPYPIKIIYGSEFYFTRNVNIKDREYYHLILLAKNNEGYKNLLKLTTIAHSEDNFYYKPRIDFEILKQHSEGLIATSACMGGLLKMSHKEEEIEVDDSEQIAKQFKELFGKDFYIEIHTNKLKGQREFNQKAIAISKKYGIPLVVACDAHYTWKHQAAEHRAWVGIGENDESAYYGTDDFYLLSEDEVYASLMPYLDFNDITEAVKNTDLIAEQCNVTIDTKHKHYPMFPCPAPYANQLEYLKDICRKGWKEKIVPYLKQHPHLYKVYAERMIHELNILEKAEYINYFLITWDILNWCHSNGIYTGVGRGSVTASLVSYLMGITKIDPIKYDLIFERFAHLERVTPPDIDVDVPRTKRHMVIDYIRSKYGEVYQVRTFGFMAEKGARKRAGQALGIKNVDDMNKGKLEIPKKLQDLATKFEGRVQNFSVHASAVIIIPSDPSNFCSLERSVDSKTKEVRYVAAYDFHDLEEQGLLKQDILGLKTCDLIQWTCDAVNVSYDKIDNLVDDDITFDMLCRGETSGCFQIESFGMTETVLEIQPKGFNDLIPLVALYRPGPKDAILDGVEWDGKPITMLKAYLLRRQGKIPVEYLHPKLKPILSPTYGIILYQEQILAIARDLCGYTLGQADVLRRIIGRKQTDKIAQAIEEMVQRGEKNGIDGQTMRKICDQIVTFANYGFNKGHSTAYGYIAYQTSYLKAHYPLQFICSLINSEENKQENILPYIEESKRLGIKILPPDIRKGNARWVIEGDALRVGLAYIKYVGEGNLESYVAACDSNDYISTIKSTPHTNKRVIECLIKAGALDWAGERQDLLLKLMDVEAEIAKTEAKIKADETRLEELIIEIGMTKETTKKFQQIKKQMANREKAIVKNKEKIKELKAIQDSDFDEIDGEKEVLGFSFNDKLECYDLSDTKPYNENLHIEQVIGCELISFKPWKTKKGKAMGFVEVRTKEQQLKLVVFSPLVKQFEKEQIGNVYILSVDGTRITDYRTPKRK